MQGEQTAPPRTDPFQADAREITRRAGGRRFTRSDVWIVAVCVVAVLVTFLVRLSGITEIGSFVLSAVSLALLARLVGRGVEALGATASDRR